MKWIQSNSFRNNKAAKRKAIEGMTNDEGYKMSIKSDIKKEDNINKEKCKQCCRLGSFISY